MIPQADILNYSNSLIFAPTINQAEQALLPAPLRHSEDLDLLLFERQPLGKVYSTFREIGEELGFSAVSVDHRRKFPKIYYQIEHENGQHGLLKIELSQEPKSRIMAANNVQQAVSMNFFDALSKEQLGSPLCEGFGVQTSQDL